MTNKQTPDVAGLVERLRNWSYDSLGDPLSAERYADVRAAAAALSAQQAEIERLKDERGTLACTGTTLNPKWTPLGEQIVRLEAELKRANAGAEKAERELAEAQKDAERYRWLREQSVMARSFGRYYWSDELDAAIDAARQRPPSP